MNKDLKDKLARAQNLVNEALNIAEEVRDDLQEDFDDKSEKWQEDEAGQALMEKIERLDELVNSIGELDFTDFT